MYDSHVDIIIASRGDRNTIEIGFETRSRQAHLEHETFCAADRGLRLGFFALGDKWMVMV